jgi:tetratricopeptide (TPR) repeat protein
VDRLQQHLSDNLEMIEEIQNLRSKYEKGPLGGARQRFSEDLSTLRRESKDALDEIDQTGIAGPQIPQQLFREINDLANPMVEVSMHLRRLAALTSAPQALIQAETTLQDAYRIDPRNPRVYYQLGRVYQKMGLDVISGEHYARAIRFGPKFKKTDEIIQRFRERVRKNPESARKQYELGFALYEAGRMDEAEEHLLNVLELEEGNKSMEKVLAFKRLKYIHQGEPPYHIMAFF